MNDFKSVNLAMSIRSRTAWNTLLQRGFYLQGTTGMTVRQFMIETVGYDDCMIEKSVRTVFLNNSPVDDIDFTHIKDGDKMALGSAMPGLIGVCMGRDNPYKSMRSGISVQDRSDDDASLSPALISLKIFSNLAVDTGAELLERGIIVDKQKIADLFEYQRDNVIDDGGFKQLSNDVDERIFLTVAFVAED